MSDENKEVQEEQCTCKFCSCISKEYKQFLATILAAFLGCLVALCLYGQALRPVAPPCPCMQGPCPIHKMHQKQFKHDKMHKHFKGAPENFKGEKPPVKPEK